MMFLALEVVCVCIYKCGVYVCVHVYAYARACVWTVTYS